MYDIMWIRIEVSTLLTFRNDKYENLKQITSFLV